MKGSSRNSRRAPWALLLAVSPAAGCVLLDADAMERWRADHGAGSPDTSNGDTATSGSCGLALSRVEPPWGNAAGGSVVSILGEGFEAGVEAWFGAEQAAVLTRSADVLQVQIPTSLTDGPVPVRVSLGGCEDTLSDGFTYWADATGQVGVLGGLVFGQYLGTYWTEGTPEPLTSGFITFIEPTAIDVPSMFGPALDTCEVDFAWAGDIQPLVLGVSNLALRTSTGILEVIPWDDDQGYFFADQIDAAFLEDGVTYDLEEIPSEVIPSLAVEGLARMPDAISLTGPALGGSTILSLSKSDLAFRWSGAPGDFAVIELLVSSSTGAVQYSITCTVKDDGAFNVPSASVGSWPTGRQVSVYLVRYGSTEAVLPYNGASSGVLAGQGVIAAFLSR